MEEKNCQPIRKKLAQTNIRLGILFQILLATNCTFTTSPKARKETIKLNYTADISIRGVMGRIDTKIRGLRILPRLLNILNIMFLALVERFQLELF